MRPERFFLFFGVLAFMMPSWSNAQDLSELYDRSLPSVVTIDAQDPFGNTIQAGTGFYVADGCSVATNYHVVQGGFMIRFTNPSGQSLTLVPQLATNPSHDLAILRVPRCGRPLQLVTSLPSVGTGVMTIGNPRGLQYSLSDGIVSGIRRGEITLIQTTAAISQGSSGGPLMDYDGAVIGITTYYLAESQALNFAIPSERLHQLLDSADFWTLSEAFPDHTNPMSVAAAFFHAIRENDVASAARFVAIGDRADFEAEIAFARPDIPEGARFTIERTHPIGGLEHVEVALQGTDIGVDLVEYPDGWRIIR